MSTPGLEVALRQEAPIPLAASFTCAPGEVLALVGRSGSGKSTILRTIAGSYRPAEGRVAVGGDTWFDDGARIFVPPHRRAVGMVFQSYALFPHMTALGNVTAAMGHVAPERRRARAAEILALVHLQGFEHRRPAELSGGERQRVAVARALAREPRVLLLDEPFSAVDKVTRQRLYREIAELRRVLEMPVVLVTHDLEEAAVLADRMCVLERGRTLQTGTPAEITNRPASVEVARLVDVRNLFDVTVLEQQVEAARTVLEWSGLRLSSRTHVRLDVGSRVTCVVPEGFVLVPEDGNAFRETRENVVAGEITGAVTVGRTAHLTLRPEHAPEVEVHFTVPLHAARSPWLALGARTSVCLLPEGVHVIGD